MKLYPVSYYSTVVVLLPGGGTMGKYAKECKNPVNPLELSS
jgi:hypothetical protein